MFLVKIFKKGIVQNKWETYSYSISWLKTVFFVACLRNVSPNNIFFFFLPFSKKKKKKKIVQLNIKKWILWLISIPQVYVFVSVMALFIFLNFWVTPALIYHVSLESHWIEL